MLFEADEIERTDMPFLLCDLRIDDYEEGAHDVIWAENEAAAIAKYAKKVDLDYETAELCAPVMAMPHWTKYRESGYVPAWELFQAGACSDCAACGERTSLDLGGALDRTNTLSESGTILCNKCAAHRGIVAL